MKVNNSEYELIGEENGKLIVRVKHMGNRVATITKAEGNIIFDFDHQQYNSDHRFERHQDRFFASDPKNPNIDPLTELRDRSSIEVTSTYSHEHLLDSIIAVENTAERQRLVDQLPDALATLTDRQRYVVTRYYCDQIKKKVIAKEMGISAVMVGRHEKAAITKLRRFYKVAEK